MSSFWPPCPQGQDEEAYLEKIRDRLCMSCEEPLDVGAEEGWKENPHYKGLCDECQEFICKKCHPTLLRTRTRICNTSPMTASLCGRGRLARPRETM